MRVRAFAFVFLFAAAFSARAAMVRVVRFDATLANVEHSALCVVPAEVKDPAVASYVCYFIIPGKGKIRDNTRASRSPQPVEQSDPPFTNWLNARLPTDPGCDLSAIAAGADFPMKDALETRCPGLTYETEVMTMGTSDTFMRNVHKAVDKTLPKKVEEAPAAAAAPVVPATTTTAIHTVEPAATTTTTTNDEAPAEGGDTGTAQLLTETQGPPKPVDNNESPLLFDWRTALLIFIAVLVTLVAAERVVFMVRWWSFLKTAFAGEELLQNAQNLAEAAAILHKQRDQERAALAIAKKTVEDAEKTLAEVDRNLDVRNAEDRAGRAAMLVLYEKELLRLGDNASSTPAAITAIEARLNERREIETLLGKSGSIVDAIRNHVDLVKGCSGAFWGNDKTATGIAVTVKEIEDYVHRLYSSINRSGPSEVDARTALQRIGEALDKLREQKETIDSQNQTLGAVRGFITSQWPDVVSSGDLDATVATLAQRMHDARARVASIGVTTGRDADSVITELADVVENSRKVARDAHEIVIHLREYLAFVDGDGESLRRIIVAECGTPNRILRLVLAAAIPPIRATVGRLTADEEARVIQLLRVPKILSELDAFLGRLSTYGHAELWRKGLQSGFSQNWLHYLFRAEAVLRTYFFATSLAEVGDALTVVAWAFRHAIATASGYQVDRIQLLGELPPTMDPAHGSTLDLRSFPDIRNRVQAVLKAQREDGFTIDVDRVGWRNGTDVGRRGTLVVANRHDWEA
jgi:hypothetical protein